MDIIYQTVQGIPVAIIRSETPVLTSVQGALDLLATTQYEGNATRIALRMDAVDPSFFVLRSGLAGEILQKFVNYGIKAAIYGDFTPYTATSKPLRDFIYESNRGKTVFFTATETEAIAALVGAPE